MSPPPISKDLWFAAALSTAALPSAMAQPSQPNQPIQAGVITAMTAGASFATGDQVLHVGTGVQPGQRLQTNGEGRLHILFLDQSAVTLGPDSEVVIETFSYDPNTRLGQIGLALNSGTLRVVGGHISKNNPTVIKTPQGTVEISGGITEVEARGNGASATFLFGQQMRATDNSGNTQTVTRPGFGVSLNNGAVTSPQPVSATQLSRNVSGIQGGSQNLNPTPNPGGPLISTGGTSSGLQSPGQTLANDRLRTSSQNDLNANPSLTLQTILGTGQTNIQS